MDTLFHTTNALDDKNNDMYNTTNIIADEVPKVLKKQINTFEW